MTGILVLLKGQWAVRYETSVRSATLQGTRPERIWYMVMRMVSMRAYTEEEKPKPGAVLTYVAQNEWIGAPGWRIVTSGAVKRKEIDHAQGDG